jgi:hypothetical protein
MRAAVSLSLILPQIIFLSLSMLFFFAFQIQICKDLKYLIISDLRHGNCGTLS